MKKPRLSAVAALLWLLVSSLLPADSQTSNEQPCMAPAGHAQNPGVILQAQQLEYVKAENRLEATGKVSVIYGDTLLLADRMEMNTESGVGTATGDVRLSTPEDQLRASRVDFDLTNERGLVYEASGLIGNTYRISSERLERLGPQRFVAQRGRLTTCTGRLPAWEFRARRVRLGQGGHVTLQHPSFRIKGVPVFYLPYAVIPYRDERTTGFLPPRLGSDSNHGTLVRSEFFWAMTDWMDSTFGLEYFSKRGYRPYAEYRYSLDPQSDGQVRSSFIHDRKTGEDLWQVFLQQRQTFGWGISGVTQLDLRSERDIQRRFARNIQQESVTHTASFASLSKRFANSRVTLRADAVEGIPDSGSDATFERLPSLHLEQFPTPLLGVAYVSMNAAAARMRASALHDNASVRRIDLFPQLSVPLRVAPWLHVTGSTGLRQTFYHREGAASGEASRSVVDVRATVDGPAWQRRYARNGSALIHLLATRLDYRYVPEVEQDDLPAYDTLDAHEHALDPLETLTLLDRVGPANYVKLRLANRFFVRSRAGQIREAAHLVIAQGFHVGGGAPGEHAGNTGGPLDIDAGVRLWHSWSLESVLRMAPRTGELQTANWRIAVDLPRGRSLFVHGNYRRNPDVLYVIGGLSVPVLKGLTAGYNTRYDGARGQFRDHVATLLYQAQCWSVNGSLRLRHNGDRTFLVEANLLYF
jgi:LPS-assembly protein